MIFERFRNLTDEEKQLAYYVDENYRVLENALEKRTIFTLNVNKLKPKTKEKSIVLLCTGGLNPLHEGHLEIIHKAKEHLENKGWDVLGGIFSISNDEYVLKKENYDEPFGVRIERVKEQLNKYDWLSLDTFESAYAFGDLNYPSVIDRTKEILKIYYGTEVQVGYVFGGDNAGFMHLFDHNSDIIGICVERNHPNYNKVKNQIRPTHLSNCIFIDNDNKEITNVNSTELRKNKKLTKLKTKGKYFVRDEDIESILEPLQAINKPFTEEQINVIKERIDFFRTSLLNLLFDCSNVEYVHFLPLQEQIEMAKIDLKDKDVISIDKYVNKNVGKSIVNVDVSRVFWLNDHQLYAKTITINENNHLKDIDKSKIYTIVDDDKISGYTIKILKKHLDKMGVKYESEPYIILDKMITKDDDFVDIVDMRDFIFGSKYGGLMVKIFNKNVRVPYISPYVNLVTRANILPEKQEYFTNEIIKMNMRLYKNLKNNKINVFTIGQLKNFVLWELEGYSPSMDIVDFLKEQLYKRTGGFLNR